MKGQASIFAAAGTIAFIAISVLLSLTIYGIITDTYPHSKSFNNESLCATCVNGSTSGTATTYLFDNANVVNDSTLICFNDSTNLMTNGASGTECLGYNVITIVGSSRLNITNTSAVANCQISNVVCSYTDDPANTQEQAFYDNNTSISFSSFQLLSIAVIVLAAVAIIIVVLLIKG